MESPLHIVFSGGVTGGHLFPGLAVAEQIARLAPGARITFCGPGGKLDRNEVARAGHEYLELACPRAPRRFWRFPHFAQHMLQGQWAAATYLRRNSVSAVVGLGGFASAPMALAAARRRIPLVLLEQNAVLGRANRWLSRLSQALCLAFDETDRTPDAARRIVHVTGTPIRSAFNTRQLKQERVLLVLGGSGGARALNEAVPRALAGLRAALDGWRVVHQSGAGDQDSTVAAYRAAGIDATVAPFITDMPAALCNAALAVCRAGGSTLAELAVIGTPAVLIPFAQAADDHQRQNARAYARGGAATLIDGAGLSPHELQKHIQSELARLLADESERIRMARAMNTFGRPDAAQRVAEIVLDLASRRDTMQSASLTQLRSISPAIQPRLPTLN